MIYLKSEIFSSWQFIILELISTIFMIIASILFIVQGFENTNFRDYKTREIKTERLLLSQFSYEVYSNILSNPFRYRSGSIKKLSAEIKINPSFDCRDIKDKELNEDICQDKIINNSTCCRAECCSRTNGGNVFCNNYNFDLENPNIKNHKILNYDDDEYFEDPRRRFCTYYNKYEKDIYSFMNQKINIEHFKYNYEELLLNQSNNESSLCIGKSKCNDSYIDCGIIDTMDRHLYAVDVDLCPANNIKYENGKFILENEHYENITNNNKIILRNIMSEISPLPHEYKNYIECPHPELRDEEITIKDVNNILKKNKNNYRKLENISIPINLIGNNIPIDNTINNNSKFNWYTTNYIGFKSEEDLIKFEKYFNKSDYKMNHLYKIGENIYPYGKYLIPSFIALVALFAYLILLIVHFFYRTKIDEKLIMIAFIFIIVVLLVMIIIESVFYKKVTDEFKEIKIEMDENYEEILDLYNKRRYQLKYLLSIIFLALAFIPIIILFLIGCELSDKKEENIIDKNIDEQIDNKENDIIINENEYDNKNINNKDNNNENINNLNSQSERKILSQINKIDLNNKNNDNNNINSEPNISTNSKTKRNPPINDENKNNNNPENNKKNENIKDVIIENYEKTNKEINIINNPNIDENSSEKSIKGNINKIIIHKKENDINEEEGDLLFNQEIDVSNSKKNNELITLKNNNQNLPKLKQTNKETLSFNEEKKIEDDDKNLNKVLTEQIHQEKTDIINIKKNNKSSDNENFINNSNHNSDSNIIYNKNE